MRGEIKMAEVIDKGWLFYFRVGEGAGSKKWRGTEGFIIVLLEGEREFTYFRRKRDESLLGYKRLEDLFSCVKGEPDKKKCVPVKVQLHLGTPMTTTADIDLSRLEVSQKFDTVKYRKSIKTGKALLCD